MLFPYVRQRIRARFCRLSETGTGMIASTFRKRKDMPPDGNSFTRVKFSVIRLYHRLFPLSIPFPKFFRGYPGLRKRRRYKQNLHKRKNTGLKSSVFFLLLPTHCLYLFVSHSLRSPAIFSVTPFHPLRILASLFTISYK